MSELSEEAGSASGAEPEGTDAEDEDYDPQDGHDCNIPLSNIHEFGALLKYPLQQKRHRFTEEENEAITKGVEEFGEGHWTQIKHAHSVALRNRTARQIKDRFRTMAATASRQTTAESEDEDAVELAENTKSFTRKGKVRPKSAKRKRKGMLSLWKEIEQKRRPKKAKCNRHRKNKKPHGHLRH